MKKKKGLYIVAVITAVLCIICIGATVWYQNSPFPTAVGFMKAMKNMDMDAMLGCIEPEKAKMISRILSYMEKMGLDREAFADRMIPGGEETFQRTGTSAIRFAGYHREGDKAYVAFSITDKEKGTVDERKINFIRIDGKWYIELSFTRAG